MFDMSVETTNKLCSQISDIIEEHNKLTSNMCEKIAEICAITKYAALNELVNELYTKYNEELLPEFIKTIENRGETNPTFCSIATIMKAGDSAINYARSLDAKVLEYTNQLSKLELLSMPLDGELSIQLKILKELPSIAWESKRMVERHIESFVIDTESSIIGHSVNYIPTLLVKMTSEFYRALADRFESKYNSLVSILDWSGQIPYTIVPHSGERVSGDVNDSYYVTFGDNKADPRYMSEPMPKPTPVASISSQNIEEEPSLDPPTTHPNMSLAENMKAEDINKEEVKPRLSKAREDLQARHREMQNGSMNVSPPLILRNNNPKDKRANTEVRRCEKQAATLSDKHVDNTEKKLSTASNEDISRLENDLSKMKEVLNKPPGKVKDINEAINHVKLIKEGTEKIMGKREKDAIKLGKNAAKFALKAVSLASLGIGLATGVGLIGLILPNLEKPFKFAKLGIGALFLGKYAYKMYSTKHSNGKKQKWVEKFEKYEKSLEEKKAKAMKYVQNRILSLDVVHNRLSENCIADIKELCGENNSKLLSIVRSSLDYRKSRRSLRVRNRSRISAKERNDLHTCASVIRYCEVMQIKCDPRIVIQKTLESCGYNSKVSRRVAYKYCNNIKRMF